MVHAEGVSFRGVIEIAARVQRFSEISPLLVVSKSTCVPQFTKLSPISNILPPRGYFSLTEVKLSIRRLRYENACALFLFPDEHELQILISNLRDHISHTGGILVRHLRRKDYLTTKCEKLCAFITAHLQARSPKRSECIILIYFLFINCKETVCIYIYLSTTRLDSSV